MFLRKAIHKVSIVIISACGKDFIKLLNICFWYYAVVEFVSWMQWYENKGYCRYCWEGSWPNSEICLALIDITEYNGIISILNLGTELSSFFLLLKCVSCVMNSSSHSPWLRIKEIFWYIKSNNGLTSAFAIAIDQNINMREYVSKMVTIDLVEFQINN